MSLGSRDSAVAESFFSRIKDELTHWRMFADRDDARTAIFDYVEVFHNRQRLHQTLNYVTPKEYEAGADVYSISLPKISVQISLPPYINCQRIPRPCG